MPTDVADSQEWIKIRLEKIEKKNKKLKKKIKMLEKKVGLLSFRNNAYPAPGKVRY